jgi:hypothetical protein
MHRCDVRRAELYGRSGSIPDEALWLSPLQASQGLSMHLQMLFFVDSIQFVTTNTSPSQSSNKSGFLDVDDGSRNGAMRQERNASLGASSGGRTSSYEHRTQLRRCRL